MELVPKDHIQFEITKKDRIEDTLRQRSEFPIKGATQTSLPIAAQKAGSLPPEAQSPFQNGKDNHFSHSTIYNKLSEFVESDTFDFAIFKESVKQAARHATTSIWSILKKTLEEYDQANDEEIIYLLGILMKMSSSFTYEHSQRVMEWSMSLASELGLSEEQMQTLKKGASFRDIGKTGLFLADTTQEEQQKISGFLKEKLEEYRGCGEFHDIGKIEIPREILHKPGKLSDEEFEIMKQHPVIGETMLKPIVSLQKILPAVRHHHERWDGLGYPDGLKSIQIPLEARIVALVDAFDAMISDRPYRKALKVETAISELIKNSGTHFDPELVGPFLKIIKQDPVLGKSSVYPLDIRPLIPNGISRKKGDRLKNESSQKVGGPSRNGEPQSTGGTDLQMKTGYHFVRLPLTPNTNPPPGDRMQTD
jgi:HD-GYP domain-containing protein (c-di-GMP phosphodiesterase class II)